MSQQRIGPRLAAIDISEGLAGRVLHDIAAGDAPFMQQPRGALEFGMIQHLAVLHLVQQGNTLRASIRPSRRPYIRANWKS